MMETHGVHLSPQMRHAAAEWGLILSPGDLPAVESPRMRAARLVAGAAVLVSAGLVMGGAGGGAAAPWMRAAIAVFLSVIGAVLLWPRPPEVLVEIEVDVRRGELRVVERRGEVRTIVSRQPVGAMKAVEVGRTIVPIPGERSGAPALDVRADVSDGGAPGGN